MNECKIQSTSMEEILPNDAMADKVDPKIYQSAVGALMYAMVCTRPDLAFAVSTVSRFMKAPQSIHWNAVKKIFRYVKGSLTMGLTFQGEPVLLGYADASFANDIETRRSTTGYVFKCGKGVISWCSKLQQTVSFSTTESEYMALAAAVQEAIYLRQLIVSCRKQDKVLHL